MPKHNPTDDVMAREALRSKLAEIIRNYGYDDGNDEPLAAVIADAFPFVELNRERTNLPGGQKVHLKRLVLTGEWEVDPAGGAGESSGGSSGN